MPQARCGQSYDFRYPTKVPDFSNHEILTGLVIREKLTRFLRRLISAANTGLFRYNLTVGIIQGQKYRGDSLVLSIGICGMFYHLPFSMALAADNDEHATLRICTI